MTCKEPRHLRISLTMFKLTYLLAALLQRLSRSTRSLEMFSSPMPHLPRRTTYKYRNRYFRTFWVESATSTETGERIDHMPRSMKKRMRGSGKTRQKRYPRSFLTLRVLPSCSLRSRRGHSSLVDFYGTRGFISYPSWTGILILRKHLLPLIHLS
jgi:hypothetical protein